MTNKEAWQPYYEYTRTVSNIIRSHSLGAIAICWLLKGKASFSISIKAALLFAALTLLSDLLQYVIAALNNKKWLEKEQNRLVNGTGTIEGDYQIPKHIDIWPYRLFKLKICFLILSFTLITYYILTTF